MRGHRYISPSPILAAALLLFPLSALAKDDFITLDVGAYLFNSRDNIAVGGPTSRGTEFRFEREGTPENDTVLRLDGTIRPFERHRLRFMWLDSTREGSGLTDRTINFRDASYTLGTRVDTSYQLQEAELAYMYSLWKSDPLEAAISLGVHYSRVVARLNAPSVNLEREASASGPIPMLGVALDYRPTERWDLFGHVYGMSASIKDYSGSAVAYRIGTRFFFTPNIGLGLAWAGVKYNFDVNKSSWEGKLDASHAGGQAFLTFRY